MKPIKVGLIGIGTVGAGTFNVLQRNQEEIRRRAGRAIEIAMVADLDTGRARTVTGGKAQVVSDANQIVDNPEIDIVIELIGGYGVARELVMRAIANGKHVVTANKALLATHGTEIFRAAQEHGVMVAFEAAVAGGIPIIKALREGLTANRIQWIAGIINGTTNFILDRMDSEGSSFDEALAVATEMHAGSPVVQINSGISLSGPRASCALMNDLEARGPKEKAGPAARFCVGTPGSYFFSAAAGTGEV